MINESFKSLFTFTAIGDVFTSLNLIQFYCLIYIGFQPSVRVATEGSTIHLKISKSSKLHFQLNLVEAAAIGQSFSSLLPLVESEQLDLCSLVGAAQNMISYLVPPLLKVSIVEYHS